MPNNFDDSAVETNRWIVPVALVTALLILMAAAWHTYQNMREFAETARWVSHTREVLANTQTVMRMLNKAESAGRGFLLNKDPQFREQFNSSIETARDGRAKLKMLTSNNQEQQQRVVRLANMIDPGIDLMEKLVSRFGSPQPDSAAANTLLANENRQMAAIRGLVEEIEQVEDQLLVERTSSYGRRLADTRNALLLSTLISSLVVVGTIFLLRRHWNLKHASHVQAIRHQQKNEQLSRYNERLLESTGEGIYGIDLNGHCTFINKAGALMLGGKPADFLGEEIHGLVHHKHIDGAEYPIEDCPIYQASHSDDACRVDDEVFWRLDDVSVPVEYSSFPLKDNKGVREGAVVTFNDISARLRSRHELQLAKEEAEAANQSKSQFLANMSHELRTPLNAVIMYSELLAEEAEDQDAPGFVPDLFKIRSAGRHLLELVNGLLDLSKVEAGKMEVYVENFNIPNVINDVVSTVQPLIEKNENQIEVKIDSDVLSMNGDVTKLRQVLYNLLSNASKFTKDGEIQLAVSRDAASKTMHFKVADSGIGMTPEQVDRLFQPFMQADASTTRKFGGTGLGLAIIKRFTDLMHGEVTVESVEGQGTTFTVILPEILQVPAASSNQIGEPESADDSAISQATVGGDDDDNANVTNKIAPPLNSSSDRKKAIVLVIDDDPSIRDILTRVLVAEGLKPVTASDGEEGLQRARELDPDLIILDVLMPKVDGWSVLSALKADDQLSDIPVIIQSVSDDRDLGYMLGATEYLVKPVDRVKLLTLLRRHIEHDEAVVMVVDDDEPTRRAVTQTLEHQGWQVDQAGNGIEALKLLKQQLPAAILLDLMMPKMDGFEFLERLQSNEEYKDIPVIVLTSKDLAPEDRTRLNGGVERVLAKGAVTRELFLEQVKRAITTIAVRERISN